MSNGYSEPLLQGERQKFIFIDVLKVIAAILITNSHFASVWPISRIASGGLLGDVLFFAISGYCLSIKRTGLKYFFPWYGKRIRRIYVSVWIVAITGIITNSTVLTGEGFIKTFIYPTEYHFVASIMVLYILWYILMGVKNKFNIPYYILFVAYGTLTLLLYIFLYDKSVYHIDVVEESFIRLLYFGAMLIGGFFRERASELGKRYSAIPMWLSVISCLVLVGAYFVTKLAVSRYSGLSVVQIITWITILAAMVSIFMIVASRETKLDMLSERVKKAIHFIAKLTLQIYLVQYAVIELFASLAFPLNLIIIVVGIVICAEVVYLVDLLIQKGIDKITIGLSKK